MTFFCPKCGCDDVTVEVRTWCRFTGNENGPDREDRSFDDEDMDSVEPIPGGEHICHDCQHTWKE